MQRVGFGADAIQQRGGLGEQRWQFAFKGAQQPLFQPRAGAALGLQGAAGGVGVHVVRVQRAGERAQLIGQRVQICQRFAHGLHLVGAALGAQGQFGLREGMDVHAHVLGAQPRLHGLRLGAGGIGGGQHAIGAILLLHIACRAAGDIFLRQLPRRALLGERAQLQGVPGMRGQGDFTLGALGGGRGARRHCGGRAAKRKRQAAPAPQLQIYGQRQNARAQQQTQRGARRAVGDRIGVGLQTIRVHAHPSLHISICARGCANTADCGRIGRLFLRREGRYFLQ